MKAFALSSLFCALVLSLVVAWVRAQSESERVTVAVSNVPTLLLWHPPK